MTAGEICLRGNMGSVHAYAARLSDTSEMTQAVNQINAALRRLREAGHAQALDSLSAVTRELDGFVRDYQQIRRSAASEVKAYATRVTDLQNQVRNARSALSIARTDVSRSRARMNSIDRVEQPYAWSVASNQNTSDRQRVRHWESELDMLDRQRTETDTQYAARLQEQASRASALANKVAGSDPTSPYAGQSLVLPVAYGYLTGLREMLNAGADLAEVASEYLASMRYGQFRPMGPKGFVKHGKGLLQQGATYQDWKTLVKQTVLEKPVKGLPDTKIQMRGARVAKPGMQEPRIKAANVNKWAGRAGTGLLVVGGVFEGYEQWNKDAYKGYETPERIGRAAAAGAVKTAAAWAGAKGGATLGATIGSLAGPAGTVIGGLIGGVVGGIAGSLAGGWLADTFTTDWIGSAVQGVANFFSGDRS